MLYLDELVIHNFKSFKHSAIKFNQGFNCIVGPNGSGKSNICDSLLFALGETSLKRMRVGTSAQLINSSSKPAKDDDVRRAYVRVRFAGDKNVEVTRSIKSTRRSPTGLTASG
jgi:chromosome segregation ATPase